MGMEMELMPEKVANFMPLFDFDILQNHIQAITPDATAKFLQHTETFFEALYPGEGGLTKNYLRDNPKALDSLPADLRAELTEGLSLQRRVITEKTQLLGADGNALGRGAEPLFKPKSAEPALEKPKLLLPSDVFKTEAAPAPPKNELMQKKGALEVPSRFDWDVLYARWEKLPEARRASAVRLELLAPKEKAVIFRVASDLSYHVLKTRDVPLPLKKGVSEKDRALFSRLEWEPDGDALEFRHKKPVSSPQEFLDDVRYLAKRAGVEREIFDPESARMASFARDAGGDFVKKGRQWGSFHYHYSLDKNLEGFADALNVNMLVRRMKLGVTSDFNPNASFRFFSDFRRKGLMRLHSTNRIEMRTHHEPLEEELSRQLSLVFTENGEVAAHKVAEQTKNLLNDEMVVKLALSENASALKGIPYPYEKLESRLEKEGRRESAVAVRMAVGHPPGSSGSCTAHFSQIGR